MTPGELASNLYLLLDKLQGTLLSSAILAYFRVYLRQSLANLQIMSQDYQELLDGLNDQILGVRKSLLIYPTNNPHSVSHEPLFVTAQKDKPLALMEYLDFLCSAFSLEEQLLLLSQQAHIFFESLLKPKVNHGFFQDLTASNLTDNPKDLFLSLHKFLDTVIYQHRYPILIPKGTVFNEDFTVFHITTQQTGHKAEDFTKLGNDEPRIVVYEDLQIKALLKKYPIYEAFEPLLDFLLRNMVLSRESISQEMKLEFIKFLISVILDRLWDIYPRYQPNMKSRLQAIFRELDRENLHICQLQAGFLLFEKLGSSKSRNNRNELLLELLKDSPQIKSSVESFQKDSHKYYRGPGLIQGLILKENCPLNQHISAGGFWIRYIETFIPGTLIYWVFATRTLDIDFQIEFLGDYSDNKGKPEVIIERKRLDTGKKVHRGVLVTNKPGIYRLTWDNSYSWFTEKFLRYRIYALEPEESSQMNETRSNHAIFNACRDVLGLDVMENHENREIGSQNNRKNEENGIIPIKKQQKVKETLENVYQFQRKIRVIGVLRERSLEVRAWDREKGSLFELVREFGGFNAEIFSESLRDVMNRVTSLEIEEKPEILLLKAQGVRGVKLNESNYEYAILDFNRVFMHLLLRKFIGVGGNLSNPARKPIPFSKILILSVIDGCLVVVTFNDTERNLALLIMGGNLTYDMAFREEKKKGNEEKAKEIAVKCLVNALILLKFRAVKVIVNRNDLLREGEEREKIRENVKKIAGNALDVEENDVEVLLGKMNVEFEVFSYEFKPEMLLK